MNKIEINTSKNHTLSFEGFFFNEEDFLRKQGENRYTFVLLNSSEKIIARSTLFLKEQMGLSPLRAPFGSVEFEKGLPASQVKSIITELLSFAVNNKLKRLKIVSYPECYNFTNSETLKNVMVGQGFHVASMDPNFHLEISDKEFDLSLHSSEKRRLKKSQQAGFKFNIGPANDVRSAHEMISKCREFKGFPLSMDYEEFEGMFKKFPERYVLFTIKDKERLIAAAIGVRINSEILYNFMPADDLEYRTFSPMVLLMKNVYDYCRNNGYKIFDMGTTGENGIPNSSLVKFKENLGGKLSYKLTFEKNYLP